MKKKLFFVVLMLGLCCFGLIKKSSAINNSDKKVYGPKSDLTKNNQVAILLEIKESNKKVVKLLTEIREIEKSNQEANNAGVEVLTEIRDLLKGEIEKKNKSHAFK